MAAEIIVLADRRPKIDYERELNAIIVEGFRLDSTELLDFSVWDRLFSDEDSA